MLTRLHQRHDDGNRERRLVRNMMTPDHFAMMQYNNQLRMQQMFIARQNWQMQLQMLYGNNYTGMQAQQFTMNAMANQQQRFNSAAWRGGINPLNSEPPGNAGMRPYPRTPAGFQQDMQGGPSLRPRTRNEVLGTRTTEVVQDAGYRPYRRNPRTTVTDQNYQTGLGSRPDEPAPAPFRRPRGRSNSPTLPRVRNPDYVPLEEEIVNFNGQRNQNNQPASTADIPGINPETGQSDISHFYRGVRFWEQGRPRTVEQAGVSRDGRSFLAYLRNERQNFTREAAGERVKMLYFAHLLEDLYLYMACNPQPSDSNAQEFVNRFNHLDSEQRQDRSIQGDMSIVLAGLNGVQLNSGIVTVFGDRLGWDQASGWFLTRPDGRVIRGTPRGSVGGRGGNGAVNYTGTGGAWKANVDARTKERGERIKQVQEQAAKLTEQTGRLQKQRDGWNRDMDAITKQQNALDEEMTSAAAELEKITGEMADVTKQIDAARKEHQEFLKKSEATIKDWEQQLDKTNGVLPLMQTLMGNMKKLQAEIKTRNDVQDKVLAPLLASRETAVKQLGAVNGRIEKMREQSTTTNAQRKKFLDQINAAEKDLKDVQEQMKKVQASLKQI